MAGNHYSRSVATLEHVLESKLKELNLLEEENYALRKREAALSAAASSIVGGLEASKIVLGSAPNSRSPSLSLPNASPTVSGSSGCSSALQQQPTASCCNTDRQASWSDLVQRAGSAGSHSCMDKLEQKEHEVQKMLDRMGCADNYPALYTTQLLQRAVQCPARTAAHLARPTAERLKYICKVVQRFGVLLPKYDLANQLVMKTGSAKQQLDSLVDDLLEMRLITALLDPPGQQMQENMVNIDTGVHETYPEGHWDIVVKGMELTEDQKAACKVCWERLKPLNQSLTEQYKTLASRLAGLHAQQQQQQCVFEQQAQTLYDEEHKRMFKQTQTPAEQQQQQQAAAAGNEVELPLLPNADYVWQQRIEAEMEAALQQHLGQCQPQQQQQQQQLLHNGNISVNQDLSYAPVSAYDIEAAAMAIINGDIWQPSAAQPQQQQQPACTAQDVASGTQCGRSSGCSGTAHWNGSVTALGTPQMQHSAMHLHASHAIPTTALQDTLTACGAPLPAQSNSFSAARQRAANMCSPRVDDGLCVDQERLRMSSGNSATGSVKQLQNAAAAAAMIPAQRAQQSQQQLKAVQQQQQASTAVVTDSTEPLVAIFKTLARSSTQEQSELLVQLCNKEQTELERTLDKVTGQLKMLHLCMVLHLYNVTSKKQIALAYLHCYPYVPEAFSFCEALDRAG